MNKFKIEKELRDAADGLKIEILNLTENKFARILDKFLEVHPDYRYEEVDNLCCIYLNNTNSTDVLCNYSYSFYIEKKTLKLLFQFPSNIIFNKLAIETLELKDPNLLECKVYKNIESPIICLYFYEGFWRIGLYNKPDALEENFKSFKSENYLGNYCKKLFKKYKIKENILEKEYCYFFICVSSKIHNFINYDEVLSDYDSKKLILFSIMELYSMQSIIEERNSKTKTIWKNFLYKEVKFESVQELEESVENKDREIRENKLFNFSGYTIVKKNKIFVVQPKILQEIIEIHSEIRHLFVTGNNEYQSYLKIYLKSPGLLKKYLTLTLVPSDKAEFINSTISIGFTQLAKEILQIYHSTRHHSNPKLYELLSKAFKDLIYDIHGIYCKRKELNEKTEKDVIVDTPTKLPIYDIETKLDLSSGISITLEDINQQIKKLPIKKIRNLFYDRMSLLLKLGETKIKNPLELENISIFNLFAGLSR